MPPTSAEDLNQTIAANLKDLRRVRGLTLDDTAEITGVSKSMLGQIEREECGLSVATLWKICTGLNISLTALMKCPSQKMEIVTTSDIEPITNGSALFRIYPIFSIAPGRDFEILYIELDSGAVSASESHVHGTQEFISVVSGVLTLVVGSESHTISAGQSIRYDADQTHAYANNCTETVQLFMTIHYA